MNVHRVFSFNIVKESKGTAGSLTVLLTCAMRRFRSRTEAALQSLAWVQLDTDRRGGQSLSPNTGAIASSLCLLKPHLPLGVYDLDVDSNSYSVRVEPCVVPYTWKYFVFL